MVLAVTQVEEVLVLSENVAHALRVMELSFIICTIDKANFTVANLGFKLHRIFIYEDQAIVSCVCDNDQISIQACLFFDADDLARVAEILSAGRPFLTALADGLIDALGFDFVGFLLLWLPSDCRRVIESFVVKIVSHGEKQI